MSISLAAIRDSLSNCTFFLSNARVLTRGTLYNAFRDNPLTLRLHGLRQLGCIALDTKFHGLVVINFRLDRSGNISQASVTFGESRKGAWRTVVIPTGPPQPDRPGLWVPRPLSRAEPGHAAPQVLGDPSRKSESRHPLILADILRNDNLSAMNGSLLAITKYPAHLTVVSNGVKQTLLVPDVLQTSAFYRRATTYVGSDVRVYHRNDRVFGLTG